MSESYVGWWGKRRQGKWHLVESEVSDRLVMRCGRQMAKVNPHGPLSFEVQPSGEACEQCTGHLVAD